MCDHQKVNNLPDLLVIDCIFYQNDCNLTFPSWRNKPVDQNEKTSEHCRCTLEQGTLATSPRVYLAFACMRLDWA